MTSSTRRGSRLSCKCMKTMFCELARETVADALASRALYHTYLERLLDVSQKESSRQATNEALLHFDKIVSRIDSKQYVLTIDTPR